MTTDTNLSPHESIKLIKEAQRLSNLNAIPGKWFCFFTSFNIGLSFGFLSNQSALALISAFLFPVIIYFQKQKTGLWPLGFAPFLGKVDSFYSFSDYWKDLLKVKIYIQLAYLLSILVLLSFPFQFINILEFRDAGNWWVTIASGTIIGLASFAMMLIDRNFQIARYSISNNE